MSRPAINPDKTLAGIAVDPQTLERVIPESRRADGSVRKQIKIRPGFTPQEDVRRFRGTKQAQMDSNVLPKGHVVGWAPPPVSTAAGAGATKPLSKSAKKNAKRKEKRDKDEVPDNWDDEDEGTEGKGTAAAPSKKEDAKDATTGAGADAPASTDAGKDSSTSAADDALSSQLKKLDVK